MAKYLLLIFGDERVWAGRSPQDRLRNDAGHRAFAAAAGTAVLGGNELTEASVATTLRADPGGRITATDGPFLETKEALGGYYLVEAADLDEVVRLARLLPELADGHSGVEIRPVVEHG
ncbi:YciI family protein [Catellatospora citrea]|nr:YciI family protein [Catellatospora citrea]RKE05975.1 hypothetical protein C8E86_0789 [Catellatospora citrea]